MEYEYGYGYGLAPSDVDGEWEIMRHAIVSDAMGCKCNQMVVGFELLHPELRFGYGWTIRCRIHTTDFADDRGT